VFQKKKTVESRRAEHIRGSAWSGKPKLEPIWARLNPELFIEVGSRLVAQNWHFFNLRHYAQL
jgi:hypothetical protein